MLANGGDHIAPPAPFPQARLLADYAHRGTDARVGQALGDIARDVVGVGVYQIFYVEDDEDDHQPFTPVMTIP